jgi:hypothetical protein
MLYIKPEVIELGNATDAVQGSQKPNLLADSHCSSYEATATAYEADE